VLTNQAKKGGFKDALPEDLLSAVFRECLKRGQVDPTKLE
jgi:acetyl-CoA acyltransferase 1